MNTIEIQVPTSWEEVTVMQYQQLQRLDGKGHVKEQTAKIITILCDIAEPLELPIDIFNEIATHLNFIADDVKAIRKRELFIDGKLFRWYGNFNQLTAGEVLSVEQIIDIENLNYTESFDVIAAILLREVKDNNIDKFDSNNFIEYRNKFSELPITDIYSMVLFFLNGGNLYIRNMKCYSVVTKMLTITQKRNRLLRIKLRMKRKLMTFINGLRWWISLQIKTSQKMMKYINKTT